jgi:hypothetical protein
MEVRPGDVLLFNPLLVWKRRAEWPAASRAAEGGAGAEPAAEAETRQALRLMLLTPSSRALPAGMVAVGQGSAAAAPGGMVGG